MPKHNKRKKPTTAYLEAENALNAEFEKKMRSGGAPPPTDKEQPSFFIDKKRPVTLYKSSEERKITYTNKLTSVDKVLALNPKVPDITNRPEKSRVIKLTPADLARATKYRNNKIAEDERIAKRRKIELTPKLDLWAPPPPKFDKKWEDVEDALVDQQAPKKPRVFAPKLPLPNLILPQPGQSYRPAAEDHHDSMAQAIAVAKKRNELEEGAEKVLTTLSRNNKQFLLRVDTGDKPPKEDPNAIPVDKPPKRTRLSAFYRKIKMRKYAIKLAKKMRAKREARAGKLEKLPEIVEEVERLAKLVEKQRALNQVKKADRKMRTPKFGTRTPFVEPLNPVALSDQIASRFRSHKALFNPLLDRYQSLVRTGKVVPFSGRKQTGKGQRKSVERTALRQEKIMSFEEGGRILRELDQL